LQSLYLKHFQPIYPSNVRSEKSLAILKAFVASDAEIVTTESLRKTLKGKVEPTNMGGYLKSLVDRGTIAKAGPGQYKLPSRLFRLYLRLRTRFGKD